jgi:hypothetical protein
MIDQIRVAATRRVGACILGCFVSYSGLPIAIAADAAALRTTAEKTGFQTTGRYTEVNELCHGYARAFPRQVRCFAFGTTPEGRTMWALAASADGTLQPEPARARNRPVFLFQGGIHAGEIDGKDAGFIALRNWLSSKAGNNLLRAVTVVFVPVFNVDGHERFGAWNRPNQVGPREMGWRTTAQNLNLNRDYVKAEAPEMRALLGLLNDWDPLVYADLHVTDGADFEHDISITGEISQSGDQMLQVAGRAMIAHIIATLNAKGSLPLDFYPNLVEEDNPKSGFAVSVAPPRYSDSYWATRNRIGLLVETHSWKPYATRVAATRNTLDAVMDMTARRGAEWLKLTREADQRAARLGGSSVALAYENTDHVRMIDFRGYAYRREPSPVSGALATHYDPGTPMIWKVPLRDELRPSITATVPRGGYLVPAAYADMVRAHLAPHGIKIERVGCALPALTAETFRATSTKRAAKTLEGHMLVSVSGAWQSEPATAAAGALFVPIAQPRARLVMAMLEPQAPDSLVSWGYFDVAFEQREYMENYVAENVAKEMLAKDPALRAAFAARLATDPAFAASPAARLNYFYARHPSWDQRFNLYPVLRLADSPNAARTCSPQ